MKKTTKAKSTPSTRGVIAKRSSIKSTPSKLRAPAKPGHVTETAGAITRVGGWDLLRGVGEPDYGFSDPGLAGVAPWLRQFCYGSPSAAASAYRPGRANAKLPRTIHLSSRREYGALVESTFGTLNRAVPSQLPRMIIRDKGPLAQTMIGRAAHRGIPLVSRPAHQPSRGDRNLTTGT
jgi:hypothetical protein